MTGTSPAVVVERSDHTVVAGGSPMDRADLEVKTDLPGDVKTSRSSRSALLGEHDGYINLSWGVEVNRPEPIYDDPFPESMPFTIANLTFYGREDRTEGTSPELPLEYLFVDHLYVQEEARRMGYGQLLWDCHVALAALGGLDSRGKIGDSKQQGAVDFLVSQGVPRGDIKHSESSTWLSEATVVWDTDGSNVTAAAPVRHTEVNVDG